MNITPIFLKKVILESDSEVWSRVRQHYLPAEYHNVYSLINKYFSEHSRLPSFDVLKLSVRSDALLNKIYAINQAEDVDVSNAELLEYVKNRFAQEDILNEVSNYLSESIMMSSAKENLDKLREIIVSVEDKVDVSDPEECMSRIELFDNQEILDKALSLGLNADYDNKIKFSPKDYILIGGVRGTGKSLTCSNIVVNAFDNLNRSSIYFTIEMSSRAILQRNCAISTGISASRLKQRNLDNTEWVKVAQWWASRFVEGDKVLARYMEHREFSKLHDELSGGKLHPDKQMDVVYAPSLTLAMIRSELDKKVELLKPSVIVIDYVNQVSRFDQKKLGQYDWTEQIEVSKAIKAMAQEYNVPIISPYQIDASGEARFAKGLLDSADAAFTLSQGDSKEEGVITFKCVKMRDNDEVSFSSTMNWETLKIGPDSVTQQTEEQVGTSSNVTSSEGVYDL